MLADSNKICTCDECQIHALETVTKAAFNDEMEPNIISMEEVLNATDEGSNQLSIDMLEKALSGVEGFEEMKSEALMATPHNS